MARASAYARSRPLLHFSLLSRVRAQVLYKQVALTAAQFIDRVQGFADEHLTMLRWASYLGRLRLLAQGWQPNGANDGANESNHRLRGLCIGI